MNTQGLCSLIGAQCADLAAIAADDRRLARRAPCSGWSVGEHVTHLGLTDQLIVATLEKALTDRAGAPPASGGISLVGRLVLLVGRIPRGRGKAPKAVTPLTVDSVALRAQIADLGRRFAAFGDAAAALERSQARSPHPYFGMLSAPQWLRFVDIHHRHHRRIVSDIERRQSDGGA